MIIRIFLLFLVLLFGISCNSTNDYRAPTGSDDALDGGSGEYTAPRALSLNNVGELHNQGFRYIDSCLCREDFHGCTKEEIRHIAYSYGVRFLENLDLDDYVRYFHAEWNRTDSYTSETASRALDQMQQLRLIDGAERSHMEEVVNLAFSENDISFVRERLAYLQWKAVREYPHETTYLMLLDIAFHSANQPKWDFMKASPLDAWSPGRVWAQDAVGGIVGGLIGNLPGAFGGALGASAAEVVTQCFDNW